MCEEEQKKKDVPYEEALDIVGEGMYTQYLALVSGLASLAADSSMQSMFFILPAVGCEMVLSPVVMGLLGSITFIGSMASSTFFGFLSDLYGRRKMLLISTFGTCVFSVLCSVSINSIFLMVSAFCMGLTLGGVFGLPYVYLSEFCCNKIRSKYITISSVLLMFANVYSPCVAWLVTWLDIHLKVTDGFDFTSWRVFLILNVLPMLLSAFMFVYLPESPKFLLINGKSTEALQILSKGYKINSKKGNAKEFPILNLSLDPEDEVQQALGKSEGGGLCQLFIRMLRQIKELFAPPLLLFTAICSLIMFEAVGLYSIIMLWIPEQASKMIEFLDKEGHQGIGLCDIMSSNNITDSSSTECKVDSDIFFICTLIGLTFVLLSVALVFLIQIIKVKIVLGTLTLLSSALCYFVVFYDSIYATIISLGIIVAILGTSMSLGFSFTVDFFPTHLRATAATVSLFFGRISVPIGSSVLGAAFTSHCLEAYTSIASLLAVIGVICFMIPSKRKKAVVA